MLDTRSNLCYSECGSCLASCFSTLARLPIPDGAFIPKSAQIKAAENPLDFSVRFIKDRSSLA